MTIAARCTICKGILGPLGPDYPHAVTLGPRATALWKETTGHDSEPDEEEGWLCDRCAKLPAEERDAAVDQAQVETIIAVLADDNPVQ